MLFKLIFKYLSPERKAALIKRKGALLSCAINGNKKCCVYTFGEIFAEVIYGVQEDVKEIKLFSSVEALNQDLSYNLIPVTK
ncbi:MAG: hypothetical protein AAFX87_00475 [Bacteroidota bacterium]